MRRSWASDRPTATWLGWMEPASLEGPQNMLLAACPYGCRWHAHPRPPLCCCRTCVGVCAEAEQAVS
jgi:hypothetical protein